LSRLNRINVAFVMPALGASEDARERAYGAGIHVFCASGEDVDGTGTRVPEFRTIKVPQSGKPDLR
jgi:hypothetical protein